MSGDGSGYHIYIKKGKSEKLLLFFSGGGVAWNEYTAARPSSCGTIVAGIPNYYWNNLRPFTQIMNIKMGITEDFNPRNLFKDFSQVIITYATGDFHIGSNDFPYTDQKGGGSILHFHGYENFRQAMKRAVELFPAPERLLIAGDSAGAFAVPALAGEICDCYYPACSDVTLLSDSGQLLYPLWRDAARDNWKAPERLWQAIHTDNITVDWYEDLCRRYPGRFKCLYASSVRDYLLSAYYNDIVNRIYASDADIQEEFFRQLTVMKDQLLDINPEFHFYFNSIRNKMVIKNGMHGGTIHTAVRTMYFHMANSDGISMERWLYDAVNGNTYNSGMNLLKK
jgi:hypothetical protein